MTLSEYLHSYLGGLASQLGWEVETGSYDFIVSETLSVYGVDSEAEATDLSKLRTLAKVVLWETVLREISFDYDYSANGASFKRSQVYEQITKNLDKALDDAQIYLPNYQITLGTFEHEEIDPYSNYPYRDRWL